MPDDQQLHCGIPRSGALAGEMPSVRIGESRGDADACALELEDFRDYLARWIARWWMPDHFVLIDEIPLGPAGKIDKWALMARLDEFDLPPAAVSGADYQPMA